MPPARYLRSSLPLALFRYGMHAGNLWIGFVWRRGVLGYAFLRRSRVCLGSCLFLSYAGCGFVASRLRLCVIMNALTARPIGLFVQEDSIATNAVAHNIRVIYSYVSESCASS